MFRLPTPVALIALGGLGLIGLSLAPGSDRAQRPRRPAAPLVFVADRTYPPLSWDDGGTPRGFDVELVRELSRVLGREIRLDLVPYEEAQRRVLSGEADALTDLGITLDRRAQYEFSDATVTHEFGFYVRRDDDSVRGLSDLSGKRVGVTRSPFVPAFLERQSDAILVTVADFDDGFAQLIDGRLDVLAFDSWVAAPMALAHASSVKQVGVPFATNATAIAAKKGRVALIAEINDGLRALKSSGALRRLEDQWRPREMMFLPEREVERLAVVIVAAALLALTLALSAWVVSLKRAMRRQRHAELALAASEDRFTTAFRASPDGMAIVDLQTHRFLDASEQLAASTGYTLDEIIGHTTSEIGFLVNDVESVRRAREAIQQQGAVRDVEFHVRRKDGATRIVVGAAGRIEVGGRPCALWALRDVTEAREVESQLRQSQKMDAVGRLAAGVAHDFNNLLTVIMGHCEVATARLAPGTDVHHALTEISKTADRAAALTGQLLAFSRRQIVQPRVVDLDQVVRETQPMLSRLIGEDITIDLALADDAGCLEIDPGQLHQVLLNLTANARDAMPAGGRLRIETARVIAGPEHATAPVDSVCLKVIDTGTGMDLDTRAKMFEPFFTTKDIGQGTGLGLATVQGIVSATHGTIDVESVPGAGSRFRLVWPRVAAAATPSPSATQPLGTVQGRGRIVLVEDETELRDLLQQYLERLGYTVLSARSGEEALTLCDATPDPPDLLVTDIVMGGMSGSELVAAMTQRYPALQVLHMSGYTDDAILRRGVLSSGVNFLQKPFALATFGQTVAALLDRAMSPRA